MHEPTYPVGRLLFNVLAMVAGFEADLIKACTREGMAVASRWAWRTCTSPRARDLFRQALSQQFDGVRIASTGFTGPSMLEAAQATVDSGHGDLFAIGRDFLATPDLVELRTGAPLNEQRQELFCSGGAEGYTVYPRVG